mmetsp:Transcript_26129/g.29927  ORF Transcript_26129/g.29927 Transcript_26129/m.29927 type:complete len:226 (-) Transcript_26129:436-1113(-)
MSGPRVTQYQSKEKMSSTRSHLKYMKIISDDKYPILYQCTLCDSTLTREYSLRMHVLSHFNIRRYECDICQRRYSSLQYLREHKYSHKGEIPFFCSVCGKKFRHSTKLSYHRRISGHYLEFKTEDDVGSIKFPSKKLHGDTKNLAHQQRQDERGNKTDIFKIHRCSASFDGNDDAIRNYVNRFDLQNHLDTPLTMPFRMLLDDPSRIEEVKALKKHLLLPCGQLV